MGVGVDSGCPSPLLLLCRRCCRPAMAKLLPLAATVLLLLLMLLLLLLPAKAK